MKNTIERAGLVAPRYQIIVTKADYLLIPSRKEKEKKMSKLSGLIGSVNLLLARLPQQAAKILARSLIEVKA